MRKITLKTVIERFSSTDGHLGTALNEQIFTYLFRTKKLENIVKIFFCNF